MHIYFLSKGGVYVAISRKQRKLLTRTVTSLILAAIIIPAYLVADGKYFFWLLRFGFLVAMVEFVTVIAESCFLPIHPVEYGVTGFVFLELLACLIGIQKLPVKLIGGCVFVCVITDIAAYLMGTFYGGTLIKKRPFPKISPNKSYEGLIFGLALGVIAAYVWTLLEPSLGSRDVYLRLAIAAPLSAIGDLVESRFKRLYDVKDSNDFLVSAPIVCIIEKPLGGRDGHGGYLDRLDSLALVLLVQLLIP